MEFSPKWIAWEITRRCNLRCVHCRSSSEMVVDEHPDFPIEEAFRLLDDIAGYATPVIVLSGGEPLLRKDVFDIAKYGTDKGLRMCMATNGSLVTDEVCENIKASGMKIVSMSLDGASPEVHDDFRNEKGAFDSVMRAAGLFKKHGIEFIINSSFTKRNEEEITRYERLDGCYVIRSNAAKLRETTEELRNHYKDLKYVEQAFRTMKTFDIQTRPIRHFNEPNVRGHIFACFLAYRVLWELRRRLSSILTRDPETRLCEAVSLADIWRELGTVSVAKLEARGKVYTKLSQISDPVKKILTLCEVPSLDEVVSE